jgi:hypothetical protein
MLTLPVDADDDQKSTSRFVHKPDDDDMACKAPITAVKNSRVPPHPESSPCSQGRAAAVVGWS